jgi:hypothetical protein
MNILTANNNMVVKIYPNLTESEFKKKELTTKFRGVRTRRFVTVFTRAHHRSLS